MHGAAANGNAGDTVTIDAFERAGDAVHVAVPDDGNLGRGRDLADPVPVGKAVVPLQAGTAMHREHLDAFAFCYRERFHHVDAIAIPTNAALERKRHIHTAPIKRGPHVMQDFLQARQVPKQARTAALARHLRRRASSVHLDKIGLERNRNLLRRCRHLVGKPPENLYTERPLLGEKP